MVTRTLLHVTFTYQLRTIYVPFTYQLRTIYVPITYHLRTNYVQFTYHLVQLRTIMCQLRTIYVTFTYQLRTITYHLRTNYVQLRTIYVSITYHLRTNYVQLRTIYVPITYNYVPITYHLRTIYVPITYNYVPFTYQSTIGTDLRVLRLAFAQLCNISVSIIKFTTATQFQPQSAQSRHPYIEGYHFKIYFTRYRSTWGYGHHVWHVNTYTVLSVEVTGEWRKLHNGERNGLYCSPDIVCVIKSKGMR